MTDKKVDQSKRRPVAPIIAIVGLPGEGKSTGLKYFPNHERVLYLNGEGSGQELPFDNNFNEKLINHPLSAIKYINAASASKDVDYVVLDTVTGLMEQYVDGPLQVAVDAGDGLNAWGEYARFYRGILKAACACTKPIILIYHMAPPEGKRKRYHITIQGAVGKSGAENRFAHVYAAHMGDVQTVKRYKHKYLEITEDEEVRTTKVILQVGQCAEYQAIPIKTREGLWDSSMPMIDGNIPLLMSVIAPEYLTPQDLKYVQDNYVHTS